MAKNEGEGKVITAGTVESTVDTPDERQEYQKTVEQELKRREQRVAKVEQEIQELEFEVNSLNAGRATHRGDAAGISSAEAYKRTLRERIAKARQVRMEALQDVEKARERKREIDEELSAQESN